MHFFALEVPEVTPQEWLKGTKWEGMPYHITLGHPGWGIPVEKVEVRRFFVFSYRFIAFVSFLQDLAVKLSGTRFRTNLRKWSQVHMYDFWVFCSSSAWSYTFLAG